MTGLLQGAFVLATLLSLVGVGVAARRLVRQVRGQPVQDVAVVPVVRGALCFCAALFVVALSIGRFGERFRDPDLPLYAAVFGMAAAVLGAAGPGRQHDGVRRRDRVLRLSSVALPVVGGALAGVAGLV